MIEIPLNEYQSLIKQIELYQDRFTMLQWIYITTAIISGILFLIAIDTQPDKETRKRIKELAKEKNKMQHVIVNGILQWYFYVSDEIMKKKIHVEHDNEAFEAWKSEKEKKLQEENQDHKQIVKPRKKLKE